MSYEWDPRKEKSNYKKHRIKFADAVIRIISARKATARERKMHEEQDEERI